MKNLKLFISAFLLITLIASCEKEKKDENITEDDFIDIKLDNNSYHADTSYTACVINNITYQERISEFRINYPIDSISIGISFGMRHITTDMSLEYCTGVKLNDNIFYKFFNVGNYKFRSWCYTNDYLTNYEPFVSITVHHNNLTYTNLRRFNNCSSHINNRFTAQNVDITERIEDWSDCENLKRKVRIKGNFECYVYKTLNDKIDSIKVSCSFVGTIDDFSRWAM